jgi:hypothetical protein
MQADFSEICNSYGFQHLRGVGLGRHVESGLITDLQTTPEDMWISEKSAYVSVPVGRAAGSATARGRCVQRLQFLPGRVRVVG